MNHVETGANFDRLYAQHPTRPQVTRKTCVKTIDGYARVRAAVSADISIAALTISHRRAQRAATAPMVERLLLEQHQRLIYGLVISFGTLLV